jgi:serine/threonine-protein kinase
MPGVWLRALASASETIWTPDGKRITYVSSQNDKPQNVFWKSADGTGTEERLVTSANPQVTETWMHDGKTLVLVEFRPGPTGWDILTLPMSSSRAPVAFLESPYCDCTPQISPSGRYLAHTSDESGRQEIQIRSFPNPGTKITVSNGGATAAWRGDERELYYMFGGAMMAVYVSPGPPLVVGKPQLLFRGAFANIQGKNYDVTRDGQRFLMVRTDERTSPSEISVVLNWQSAFEPFRSAATR